MIRLRRHPLLPVLLLLLSGCVGGLSSAPDQPQESEYIDLEEPIVLDLNVLPMQVVYPTEGGQERSSLQASSDTPSYTTLTEPTVNTKKLKVDLYSEEVFGNVDIPKTFFTLDMTGYDHIKSLSIPELRPEQYRVEGLVPTSPYRDNPDMPGYTQSETDLPGKVTVTLYSIPRSGTMTFLANARVYRNCLPKFEDRLNRKIGDLDLDNPYFLVFNPRYQMNSTVSDQFADIRGTDEAKSVVYPDNNPLQYIPMYGRLYNVRRDPKDRHKLLGSKSEDGPVDRVQTIRLERALSILFVRSIPQSLTTGEESHQFYDGDYLIEYANVGVRCNIASILPGKWEEVKKQTSKHIAPINAKKGTPLSLYDYIGRSMVVFDYKEEPFDASAVTKAANANVIGYSCLLIGENLPGDVKDQNTLHLEVTKFKGRVDPKTSDFTYQLISKRGEYVYHMPYGELNPVTGLREIHRNRIYVIAIDLKKLVRASSGFYVPSWTKDFDVTIDI